MRLFGHNSEHIERVCETATLLILTSFMFGFMLIFTADSEAGAETGWPEDESGTLNFAHRGASAAAPENTFAAFDRAISSGADVIELDVRLTADGRVAVIHDATVDRTTDGSGEVHSMTMEELSRLDAGYGFAPGGGNLYREKPGIPTLGAVLRRYPDALLNVEIKDESRLAAREVVRVIEARRAEERVLLASRHHAVIREAREESGREIPTGASGREALAFIALGRLGLSGLLDPEYERLQIPPSRNGVALVTPDLVSDAKDSGIAVDVWTVNDPQKMRKLEAIGVGGIVTDHPERFPTDDASAYQADSIPLASRVRSSPATRITVHSSIGLAPRDL